MLKLIHTADLHLGAKFTFLGDKASEHRQRQWNTLEEIVKLAIREKVQLLVIVGDIFDQPFPDTGSIGRFSRLVARLAEEGIYTVILPGNHDRILAKSVWADFQETEFIRVIKQESPTVLEIDALQVQIYGQASADQKSQKSPLDGLAELIGRSRKPGFAQIVLAHGSVQVHSNNSNFPITNTEISVLAADYLALGDWHGCKDVSQGEQIAWYSGAPELIASDQNESGYSLLVEVNTDAPTKVSKMSVSQLKFLRKSYNLSQVDLDSAIKEIISMADNQTILELDIQGVSGDAINIESIYAELGNSFYYLIIKDNSKLSVQSYNLNNYPKDSLPRKFTEKIEKMTNNGKIPSNVKDKIIKLGLGVLTDDI